MYQYTVTLKFVVKDEVEYKHNTELSTNYYETAKQSFWIYVGVLKDSSENGTVQWMNNRDGEDKAKLVMYYEKNF